MLPKDVIDKIETEEDLERALQQRDQETISDQNESINYDHVQENPSPALDPDLSSNSSDQFQEAIGSIDEIGASRETDDLAFSTCIICQQPCERAQSCANCHLTCHTKCGVPNCGNGDDFNEQHGSTTTCFICKRGESSSEERQGAKRAMIQQADKMQQLSNKRFKKGEVGESVRVPVPDLDRGRVDHRNLIGVILEVENDFYKIGTKDGVLKGLYTRGQFELCGERFLEIGSVPEKEISVREGNTCSSIGTGQGFQRCSCTTKCETKRCACRKSGKLCNSKCHSSLSCTNK